MNLSRGVITIEVDPQTYDKLERGDGRARFTIAHELGHAFLHCDVMRKTCLHRDTKFMVLQELGHHKPQCDTECQADAFAGALLMPAPALWKLGAFHLQCMTPQIAERFSVSKLAAEIRLRYCRHNRGPLRIYQDWDKIHEVAPLASEPQKISSSRNNRYPTWPSSKECQIGF